MESREILADWDTYSDEHTDPDGWPHDPLSYGRRMMRRDAETWRSFQRIRPAARNMLATAEVQLQLLNPAVIQTRWVWQLSELTTALAQLETLQDEWLDARDSWPSEAAPGTEEFDDALAERNEEAWSYLDTWSAQGQALVEIHALALTAPSRVLTSTPSPAVSPKVVGRAAGRRG
ncbi:hypothetical protein ACK389_10480 [Streptomyces antibioticus]|uniref:hypothetical protein n=1 Tax=Streptomyces TaxID=1883 RepID=UPI00198E82A6|nr:hypothetical protein [Streptomyces tanashiensis]GGT22445.1 hypothetical protein GCM10010222_75470 [Streptomyces tanashiensis]